MERTVLKGVCVAAVTGVAAAAPPATAAPDSVHVRVLAIHDVHGALRTAEFPWSGGRPIGGIIALDAVMDAAEAECGCVVLRLDGGDQMQGTLDSNLSHGAAAVQALNLLGLDAAAIGNHELDWGVDTLLARRAEAHYPWLAANVREKASGRSPEWAPPLALIERGGIRVAVVGYLTADVRRTLRAQVTEPYEFLRGVDGVRDALAAARRLRADFTVIVAHAGGQCDARGCAGEMVELASALEPGVVDLIVGGHAHVQGFGLVNGTPIVRAGADTRAVAVVDLIRRADGGRSHRTRVDTVYAEAMAGDPIITKALEPHFRRADSVANQTVATLNEPLGRRGRELPNLIADAIRFTADADIGLHNPGGTRSELPAGEITFGQVYRVEPFGNQIHRLRLTGADLHDLAERTVGDVLPGTPFFFSGVRIEFDPAAPRGERIRSLARSDGTPIAPDSIYSLATSAYLAEGGDDLVMLTTFEAEVLEWTVRDALVSHLRSLPQPVSPPRDARVVPVRVP